MSTTQALVKEHQLILKYVDLMEHSAKLNLQNSDLEILFDQATFFIDFIEEFADKIHHAKEENILFRYLEIPGILIPCNPVPQMLHEHEQARGYALNMKTALASKNLKDLANNALQYANLLKEHIFKEDNILYPMAEKGLSNEYKNAILNAFAETEAKLDSASIWEKYETLLLELEKELKA